MAVSRKKDDRPLRVRVAEKLLPPGWHVAKNPPKTGPRPTRPLTPFQRRGRPTGPPPGCGTAPTYLGSSFLVSEDNTALG